MLVVATAINIITTISTLVWLGSHSIHTLLTLLLVTPALTIFIDSIVAILGKDAIQFKIYRAILFYTGWKDQGATKVPAITINSQNMIGKKARKYLKSQNLTEKEVETFQAILPNWEKSLDSLITLCKNINQYNNKLLVK